MNTDIVTLTAAKGTLEIIPVKVLFESVIVILGLIRVSIIVLSHFFYSCPRYGQDKMVDDSAFVELAKYCVRACHMLKTVTEGRDVDSLNRLAKKAIKNLEGYIIPA